MKRLTTAMFLIFCFNAFATEVYNCDFFGPDYKLVIDDEGQISLENSLTKFECSKYYEPFPGTEVDLTKILCQSGSKKMSFYYTQYSENEIILSKNLVFSKDISCKK